MDSTPSRRSVLKTVGVAATAALAGCGSGGGSENGTDSSGGSESGTGTEADLAVGTPPAEGVANEFAYTFEEGDAVVGNPLTGLEINYPSDSGALSNVAITSATLGGTDVVGDVTGTDVLNGGDTLRVEMGGSATIQAGSELAFELAGVTDGDYSVDVTVNPEGGKTVFFASV